jgi:hypothetical protein
MSKEAAESKVVIGFHDLSFNEAVLGKHIASNIRKVELCLAFVDLPDSTFCRRSQNNRNGRRSKGSHILEQGGDSRSYTFGCDDAVDGCGRVSKTRESNSKFSNILIVLLTAKEDEESKIEGLRLCVDAYPTKPFSSKKLRAIVESTLAPTQ